MNYDQFCKILGLKINLAREKQRMSQQDLAANLGVARQTVHRWERGLEGMTLYRLTTIHLALGVPFWGLLPTEEELSDPDKAMSEIWKGFQKIDACKNKGGSK